MSHQPIIKVENFGGGADHAGGLHGAPSSPRRHSGDIVASSSSAAASSSGSNRSPTHKRRGSRSPLNKSGSTDRDAAADPTAHIFGESSLGARLNLNLNVRRKSSPCIGGLPAGFGQGSSRSTNTSPSRGHSSHHHGGGGGHHSRQQHAGGSGHHHHHRGHGGGRGGGGAGGGGAGNQLKLELSPTSERAYHHRRRLSSPPSFDPQSSCCEGGAGSGGSGGSCGHCSSGSNHSSGAGSLQQLAIGGLNASSTDIRENTVRSGHQDIRTLYAPNNVTYPPERVSINLVNAPDESLLQCDCGHINCPLCNLMMNLELTDPTLLS